MKSKILFLCLNAFILSLSMSVHAQEAQVTMGDDVLPPVVNSVEVLPEADILPDVKLNQKTHPEKIVFSQYKLGKEIPDFDIFAKASPFVTKAQDIDKSAMILSEYNRISNGFNMHNEKQPLVVHTRLRTDEYSSLQNIIVFDELDNKTFFRFKMYGQNVGIVPKDINMFSHLQLSPERAERMFAALDGNNTVLAEFILQPFYSDRNEPFTFKEEDYWLMMARVGEFRIWDDNIQDPTLLWYYRAPWYTPKRDESLDTLFNQIDQKQAGQ